MAYVLGFIFADGCLVQHKNGYHGLDITSKDMRHLRLIRQQLSAEHKIGKKERGYRIQIRNRKICSDLISLGLIARKSKRVRFPKIPKAFFSHFVRGLFDGDGSVFVWKDPRWKHALQIRTTFCSASPKFIKMLHSELSRKARLNGGYLRHGSRVMELGYAIADSLNLYRFMYAQKDSIYLSRKKKVFEKFLASH